jgi:hypothetical protein
MINHRSLFGLENSVTLTGRTELPMQYFSDSVYQSLVRLSATGSASVVDKVLVQMHGG